jgi:hypothetical protein
MPKLLKRGNGLSNKALGWIGIAVALAASIILDKDGQPNKWHPAIMWTVVAFYGLLLFGRKKWRTVRFWCFWLASLALHVFAMWFIFGRLLPRLVLGTLFVVPLAFVETILLTGLFFRVISRVRAT